jgi:S-formylglutathione hydrolase FrmB
MPETHRTVPSAVVEVGSYYSRALGREQPYTLLTPATWNRTEPLPVVFLLHGRDFGHDSWARYTRLARYAAGMRVVFVCPQGDNGWYTNGIRGMRYEDDLTDDCVSAVRQRLPLQPPGTAWAIGGASMGGYGAVKIALKRPDLFHTAFSLSGALERTRMPKEDAIFGDPERDAAFRQQENPFALAEMALCKMPVDRPRLFVDCGLDDRLLEGNRRFRDHLGFIGYPVDYTERPGRHTWPYFDRALKALLPVVARTLSRGAER